MRLLQQRSIQIAIVSIVLIAVVALVVVLNAPPTPVGVTVTPEDDFTQLLADNPPGTTFIFQPGIYRRIEIVPRDGDRFIGQSDGEVIFNGAMELTDFKRDGDYWVAEGHGWGRTSNNDVCLDGFPRCTEPYNVFRDGQPLLHMDSVENLESGQYFFDYDANLVYLVDDPEGHLLELAASGGAFYGEAKNVTIQNITVEKYSNRAQHGAIHAPDTEGWIVDNVTARLNHGTGIRIGNGMQITNSKVIQNGQLGIGGIGDNVLVENTEIALNNFAGYRWSWEAGGTKFVRTHDLVVRGNTVHNNIGPGLWTDIDNINTLYENNTVIYNDGAGIFHEISYDATIRNNVVKFNGLAFNVWMWGAQILVSSSSNVNITENEVVVHPDGGNGITIVQQDRGEGVNGQYYSANVSVTHNEIVYMGSRGISGAAADFEYDAFWNNNNQFNENTYYAAELQRNHWEWRGDPQGWDMFQSNQQENEGTLSNTIPDDAGNVPEAIQELFESRATIS